MIERQSILNAADSEKGIQFRCEEAIDKQYAIRKSHGVIFDVQVRH